MGIRFHIVGLTEAEAKASLQHHGTPETCGIPACDGDVAIVILFKRPGAAWGQEISCVAGCSVHEEELLGVLSEALGGLSRFTKVVVELNA